jgi:tRNA(Phe) wybutosine-synthesizing methylase Tyw3
MTFTAFGVLYQLLLPGLKQVIFKAGHPVSSSENHKMITAPNGPILLQVRLACALRYFAGGSVLYNIATTCGISHTSVHNSVNYVVEAVNQHYTP